MNIGEESTDIFQDLNIEEKSTETIHSLTCLTIYQQICEFNVHLQVISLSTATQDKHEFRQFKKEEWERGLRFVEILELTIQKTWHQINTNAITPHLQYQLHPFVDSGGMLPPVCVATTCVCYLLFALQSC